MIFSCGNRKSMHCWFVRVPQRNRKYRTYMEREEKKREGREVRGCRQLAHAVEKVRRSDTGKLTVQVQAEW